MRICTGHNEELMNMRQTRAEGYEDGEAAGRKIGEEIGRQQGEEIGTNRINH